MTTQDDALAASLDHLNPLFADCRDLRHPWKVTRDFHLVNTDLDRDSRPRMGQRRYVERTLTCTRCGTERSEAYAVRESAYGSSLRKLSVTYSHPDGYLLKGLGQLGNVAELIRGLHWSQLQERPPAAAGSRGKKTSRAG